MPVVVIIILVVPNIIIIATTKELQKLHNGHGLLNCEALPGSGVSVFYSF